MYADKEKKCEYGTNNKKNLHFIKKHAIIMERLCRLALRGRRRADSPKGGAKNE